MASSEQMPGRPEVFDPGDDPSISPDAGLPPLMMNDRGPSYAPTAAQQDALLRTDRQPTAQPTVHRSVGVEVGKFGWGLGAGDFAPNGYRPNESRSTGVGKYGGSPLYAATIGYPDSVVASRLQGIAKEQQQIAEQLAKFNPAAGIEDVKQPEYRDDFQRGVMGDLHGYEANVQKLYGDEEGLKRLMDPNTAEGQGIRARANHWTTIARLTNQGTDSAVAVVNGMDDGTLENNPYLYDMATEQLHKLGTRSGNHDPEDLAKGLTVFTGTVSLDDQVHKDGIVDLLKNAGSVHQIAEQVRKGDPDYVKGFRTMREMKTEDRSAAAEALTDRYYPTYRSYMSRDEMKKYFDSIVKNVSEEKLTQSQIHVPKGSGSTDSAVNYRVENTELPPGASDAYGNTAQGVSGSWPTVSLLGTSNKQATLAHPLSFRHGDKDSFMYPERVMRVHGKDIILGKEVGMPRTAAQKAAAAKNTGFDLKEIQAGVSAYDSDPSSPEAQAAIQKFGVLQARMVPFEGNESLIEGMNYDPEKVKSALMAQQAAPTTKKSGGRYTIKGKTYTLDQLQGMGYTADQVAPYLTK
jgi:hypothetical protein